MSTDRYPQWFVAQAVRNREIAAALSVVRLGFEAHVPIIRKQRKIGRILAEVDMPRFGTYIFVRFDAFLDDWGALWRKQRRIPERRYFERVLCNAAGDPSPVPDAAMEAIRAYSPPKEETTMPHVYSPGERCSVYIAGQRMEAAFVKYQGNRQFVRTWILGAEHVTEVRAAELEPLDLDGGKPLAIQAS